MLNDIGVATFELVNTYTPAEPSNVYRQAAVDLIFGQVWTRPGMTHRQRRWVSLSAAGMTGTPVGITAHIYGALNSEQISAEEMGEFLLHFACYAGWPKATLLDSVIDQVLQRIASERDQPPADRSFASLRDEPLEDLAAAAPGIQSTVLDASAASLPEVATPVSTVLVGGLEYGQIWSRPQLPRSDRRLITLTCLAIQGAEAPLRAHLRAALEAREFDVSALREVALHAGLYAGLTVGQTIDAAVTEVAPCPVPDHPST